MPASAKIVFLDRGTLPHDLVLRAPAFPHELVSHERTQPHQVAERVEDAEIVITNKAPVGVEEIARAKKLRLIAVAATGTNIVDVAACAARGITVCNVRNYSVNSVPEHTMALLLALRRSILPFADAVRRGRWQEAGQFCFFDYPVQDLAGATIGIIGHGVVGKRVAQLAGAFGMRVLVAARKSAAGITPSQTAFEDVLAQSDVLTLHCPLTPATKGMIGDQEFRRMTRRPLVINTARGGIVDEAALAEALVAGRISGAAFDVTSAEPPPEGHPFQALLGRPDFILTPHIAWSSRTAIETLADQLISNIDRFWSGTPQIVVAPS